MEFRSLTSNKHHKVIALEKSLSLNSHKRKPGKQDRSNNANWREWGLRLFINSVVPNSLSKELNRFDLKSLGSSSLTSLLFIKSRQ